MKKNIVGMQRSLLPIKTSNISLTTAIAQSNPLLKQSTFCRLSFQYAVIQYIGLIPSSIGAHGNEEVQYYNHVQDQSHRPSNIADEDRPPTGCPYSSSQQQERRPGYTKK
jgi:hypothetical protein